MPLGPEPEGQTKVEKLQRAVTTDTRVSLSVLFVLISAALWLVKGQLDSSAELKVFRAEVKGELKEIKTSIEAANQNTLSKVQFYRWVQRFKDQNPTLKIPDVEFN